MHEEWRDIVSFPGYAVSDQGSVRNEETGHMMTQLVNQRGIVNVGLTKNKVQYKRALAIIVAEAFLTRPSHLFNTPINLDGNRRNNRASNLLWRPKWFATKYFQQFGQGAPCVTRKVQNVETEEVFEDSWHAAVSLGALDRDIAFAIFSGSRARIVLQHFRLLR